QRTSLEQEALPAAFVGVSPRDELDGHLPVEQHIVAQVHQAHAAGAERPHQAVAIKGGRRDPTSLRANAFPRRQHERTTLSGGGGDCKTRCDRGRRTGAPRRCRCTGGYATACTERHARPAAIARAGQPRGSAERLAMRWSAGTSAAAAPPDG